MGSEGCDATGESLITASTLRRPSWMVARALGNASNPIICDSQRDWCRRVGNFVLRYEASQAVAYNHFFSRQG